MAHRICRLIWLPFHRRVRYGEHGPAVQESSKPARTTRMIRQLRNLGYRVELPAQNPAQGARNFRPCSAHGKKGRLSARPFSWLSNLRCLELQPQRKLQDALCVTVVVDPSPLRAGDIAEQT